MPEHSPAAPLVASLPMYDWPEVAWATDALWRAVADQLREAGMAAPAALCRGRKAEELWRDPALVLSQTCGYPFATRLQESVRLVATPVYRADGCDGPFYSSIVVARREAQGRALADFTGGRAAFNLCDSLSGYVALVAAMREAGLAPDAVEWIETGNHRASVRAVAKGRADVAAIDAVCWGLASRFEPEAVSQLAAIGRTPLRPGLPLITAGGRCDAEVEAIRSAFAEAVTSRETAAARAALGIDGVESLRPSDYAPLALLLR